MKRREFLMWTAFGGASLLLPLRRAWPYSQSPTSLRKFIQPLPGLRPTGIPVATPSTTRFPCVDYYEISLGQFKQQLHPDLPAETMLSRVKSAVERHSGSASIFSGSSPCFTMNGFVGTALSIRRFPGSIPTASDTMLDLVVRFSPLIGEMWTRSRPPACRAIPIGRGRAPRRRGCLTSARGLPAGSSRPARQSVCPSGHTLPSCRRNLPNRGTDDHRIRRRRIRTPSQQNASHRRRPRLVRVLSSELLK